MEAIWTRRSVRRFTDQAVEPEALERILRAGMQSPSAHNLQPWEFVVVREPARRQALAALSPYAGPAAACDTCVAVLADLARVPRGSQWWVQDLGACVENLLLQAETEGLGAVWMGFYPEEERVRGAAALLELPEDLVCYALVAIGHPAQPHRPADRYDPARVHWETYNGK